MNANTFFFVLYLIKNPDLSINGGSRHSVAVVVEEDSLLFGVASQGRAQLLHLVHRGVQALFVTSLKNRKGVERRDQYLEVRTWVYLPSMT